PVPTKSKSPAWDEPSKEEDTGRARRRRDYDDDDEDDDAVDKRKSRRAPVRRGHFLPHRGGMILAFGIIGIVGMPIFGVVAWVMGNNDLREMQAGRMDPEGESMTQTGRILGMIATIMGIVVLVISCGIFAF